MDIGLNQIPVGLKVHVCDARVCWKVGKEKMYFLPKDKFLMLINS